MAGTERQPTTKNISEALCELAQTDEDIVVLDADLSAATKTSIFQKKYPERFINCGIAEGNMVGVAKINDAGTSLAVTDVTLTGAGL